MIIDADCHISSHKFDGLAITADELVEQMDRAGVDKALVWLKPPYNLHSALCVRGYKPTGVTRLTLRSPGRYMARAAVVTRHTF
jgi:Tat protein secretion system quality control protein TatD with DNase activity